MSLFKKLFAKPAPADMTPPPDDTLNAPAGDATASYDYPGEYAGRFDGIDPGSGDSAESHPDFAWLPTYNPQSPDSGGDTATHEVGHWMPSAPAGDPPQPNDALTAARFSLTDGEQPAQFTELQAVSEDGDVDYVDTRDSDDTLHVLPQPDGEAPSADLGSWTEAQGLDVTLDTPDYQADDRFNGQYRVEGVTHKSPEPVSHELAHVQQQGAQDEGGHNNMVHQLPTRLDPNDAPDDLAGEDDGADAAPFRNIGGLQAEHDLIEDHPSTLLDLSSGHGDPQPIDPPDPEAAVHLDIEDLDDLL
jgi:hypothetical protein